MQRQHNNPAIRTQRFQIHHNLERFDYDCIKTKKAPSNQFKSQSTSQINGAKVTQTSESMNLFVQAILDMQIKQHNGTSRLEKDVQDMLQSFQKSSEDKKNDIVSSPIKTVQLEKGSYSPEAYQLMVQNKHFINTYERIIQKLMINIDPAKSLFTNQKWHQILEPLSKQQVYLTIKERLQLIKTVYYLIKVEFGIPLSEKQQQVHLLTKKYTLNEFNFCEQIAYELTKLKTKIKNRKNQTLKVLTLMENFSSLNMDFSQLSDSLQFTKSEHDKDKKIDQRAFELCKKDIYAFSFVTLYISNCINLQLSREPEKVFDLVQKIKLVFKTLSSKYPPNPTDNGKVQIDTENVQLIIDDSFKKGNLYIPSIKLTKILSVEQKVKKIQSQILQKARIAKSNKVMFDQVLRPLCQKRGKDYQCGLKIRTDSTQDRLTKSRAFEKIIFKKQNQGLSSFQKDFQNEKQYIVESFVTNAANCFNKIFVFNELCFVEFDHLRKHHVLKSKEEVPFEVFDLLRAKAVFEKPSDIIKTANQIYDKFIEIRSGYYNLLQYDNRLKEKTRDFQLNFLINGTLSELQLVLNLDKNANEFNHKLYELERSKNLTPLITLQAMNDELAEKFFVDQLQLCYIIKERDSKNNGYLEDSVKLKQFEKLVSMNASSGEQESKSLHDVVFSADRQKQQKAIDRYLYKANQFVRKKEQTLYNKDRTFKREALRQANQRLSFKEKHY